VGDALARRLWPGADPLGRRLRFVPRPGGERGAGDGPWLTVVGVVGEIRGSLAAAGTPSVYLPMAQAGSTTVTIVTRVRDGSTNPLPALAEVLSGLDPSLALYAAGWLGESVANAGRPSRFLATFLGAFSAFAVALAVIGLYAVLAYAAAERRRDVAIRMALGARRGAVTRHFLVQGLWLAGAGAPVGIAGAVLLTRRLSAQLHGVDATGPATYAAGALLLLGIAAIATWIPARRAAVGDPMEVLREE
jgi:putative ABC transport system permease protein